MNSRDKFLQELSEKLFAMGHTPEHWVKGRWGFHINCQVCGAFASVTVSTKKVREFPEDTCKQRLQSLREYEKEWRKKNG